MSDLQIFCPNCKSSIKLTESIAAPLLESTVKEYEDKIKRISLEENEKAKKQTEIDIGKKDQELEILKQRIQDNLKKLSEAQKAQVETLKKQQELDDAKREIDLTVQKKIQSLRLTLFPSIR